MERAPSLPLALGSVVSFRFPVTGGAYLARVASEPTGGDFAAHIIGFPNGPEGLQPGDRVTVSPEWVTEVLEDAR